MSLDSAGQPVSVAKAIAKTGSLSSQEFFIKYLNFLIMWVNIEKFWGII
jgi:hypothetical protein